MKEPTINAGPHHDRAPIKCSMRGICDALKAHKRDPFHDRGHWSWQPERKERKPRKRKATKEQSAELVKSLMDDLGL